MQIKGNRLRWLRSNTHRRPWAIALLLVATWAGYLVSLLLLGDRFGFWPLLAIIPVLVTVWAFAAAIARDAEDAELRTSEARFKAVFDYAPIPLAVVGPDSRFIEANQALCDFVGYEQSELVGLSTKELTAPEYWPESERVVRTAVEEGVDSYSLQKKWQRKDGTLVEGILKVAAYHGIDGQRYGVPHIVDLTDQIATEEALRNQISARDTFLGAVSHELRTPLTAVTGLAHELGNRWSDFSDDERRELVVMIANQADDVAQLIEDLLVATQPERESLALSIERFNLANELDLVLNARGGVRPEVSADATITAQGDRLRVRQIIRNLLTNAARYGGSRVHVELDGCEKNARLRVIDNGDGVPEDQVDLIFDAYGRAHSPPSDHGATGLGLSVSRRLARLMNGDLTYDREGGQTRFELILPAASVSQDLVDDPAPEIVGGSLPMGRQTTAVEGW